MSKEIWKDISGYGGRYQASTEGRVRSLDRDVWDGHGYRSIKGRILKPAKSTTYNYLVVSLDKHGGKSVHRLILITFIGAQPKGYEGMHLDGNTANNKSSNLKWGTCSENREMMIRHGKRQFIEEDIRYIRNWAYKYIGAQADLARHYDVNARIINNIATGKNYSHVI